ncbi:lysophospholipid acyltransferase family protein [bacterium]|nr:lysophospholipid acyltransferase family protein [bacterium]
MTRVRETFDQRQPLIVYANHPSWWDPLIAHFLNQKLFSPRQFFAPIDAEALEQYRVLSKLGFYKVSVNHRQAIADFIRTSQAILNSGNSTIWITPEGRFTDARDHSASLMPGLAHLCKQTGRGYVIPLALEYVFWNEPRPVCLASFGNPQPMAELANLSKAEYSSHLEQSLRRVQTRLEQLAIQRQSEAFVPVLSGKSGPAGIYRIARQITGKMLRKPVRQRHGDQF